MNRSRFSRIAHGDMPYWNPVSPELLHAWVAELPLESASRVVDIGCGRGELALRIAQAHGCRVDAYDRDEGVIALALEALRRRPTAGEVAFHAEAFDSSRHLSPAPDLVVCIGSSQAVGSPRETLERLAAALPTGSHLLFGDGAWKQDPPAGYLEFLGAKREDLPTHSGYRDLAGELGMQIVRSHEATLEEWEQYEDTYAGNAWAYAHAHPDDPDTPAILARNGAWQAAYERWGRDTLGFSLFLAVRG